jgi:hypothetical protein
VLLHKKQLVGYIYNRPIKLPLSEEEEEKICLPCTREIFDEENVGPTRVLVGEQINPTILRMLPELGSSAAPVTEEYAPDYVLPPPPPVGSGSDYNGWLYGQPMVTKAETIVGTSISSELELTGIVSLKLDRYHFELTQKLQDEGHWVEDNLARVDTRDWSNRSIRVQVTTVNPKERKVPSQELMGFLYLGNNRYSDLAQNYQAILGGKLPAENSLAAMLIQVMSDFIPKKPFSPPTPALTLEPNANGKKYGSELTVEMTTVIPVKSRRLVPVSWGTPVPPGEYLVEPVKGLEALEKVEVDTCVTVYLTRQSSEIGYVIISNNGRKLKKITMGSLIGYGYAGLPNFRSHLPRLTASTMEHLTTQGIGDRFVMPLLKIQNDPGQKSGGTADREDMVQGVFPNATPRFDHQFEENKDPPHWSSESSVGTEEKKDESLSEGDNPGQEGKELTRGASARKTIWEENMEIKKGYTGETSEKEIPRQEQRRYRRPSAPLVEHIPTSAPPLATETLAFGESTGLIAEKCITIPAGATQEVTVLWPKPIRPGSYFFERSMLSLNSNCLNAVDRVYTSSTLPFSRTGIVYLVNIGTSAVDIKCHSVVGFGYAKPQQFYEPEDASRPASNDRVEETLEANPRMRSLERTTSPTIPKRRSRKLDQKFSHQPLALLKRENSSFY